MKSMKWLSLALLCGVMGCALDSSENATSEPQDEESADNASVAQPLTAAEGHDALVDDSAPPVVDEDDGEPIGDHCPEIKRRRRPLFAARQTYLPRSVRDSPHPMPPMTRRPSWTSRSAPNEPNSCRPQITPG